MQAHRDGKEDQLDVLGLVLNAPPSRLARGSNQALS